MRTTSAWPLAAVWALLIAYASLYPFGEWRDQGLMPWSFLAAPWPRYWTAFDVVTNVLGYLPMGFLIAAAVVRGWGSRAPVAWGLGLGTGLSFVLECTQAYLPARVPSQLDWIANAAGAWLGAAAASLAHRVGAFGAWDRWRQRWLAAGAHGALVLLALWPVALLFPVAVTFGTGQVAERLEALLATWLADTPFLDWLPMRAVERQPLSASMEIWCVALGALVPMLLAYGIVQSRRRRVLLTLLLLAVGIGMSMLSASLTWGPQHGLDAFDNAARRGCLLALILALPCVFFGVRLCAAMGLVVAVTQLSMLNQAPEGAYFAITLQTWEQGRFIRFHGLAQWIGWLWPFACIAYWLRQLAAAGPSVARGRRA